MENIFFSEDNIKSQTVKFIQSLNPPKENINADFLNKCRNIVKDNMSQVYSKYGNMKPNGVDHKTYIEKLNIKSLSNSVKLVKNNQAPSKPPIKTQTQSEQYPYGVPKRNDQSLMNRTPGQMNNNITHPQQKNTPSTEYATFSGSSDFAPFSSNMNGSFITATGQYSDKPIGDIEDNNDTKKSSYRDEMEKKYNSIQYEQSNRGNYNNPQQNNGQNNGQGNYYGVPNNGQQIDDATLKYLNLDRGDINIGGQTNNDFMSNNPNNPNNMNNNNNNNNNSNEMEQLNNRLSQLIQNKQFNSPEYKNVLEQISKLSGINNNNNNNNNNMNSYDFGGGNTEDNNGTSLDMAYSRKITDFSNSGDINGQLEKIKNERNQIDNQIKNAPKNTKFDPTQSPNINKQNEPNFFFQ